MKGRPLLSQGWLRRGQLPPCSNHSCEGRTPSLGRGGGPAPFPPLGTRFRGHDDATTVIPAPEQESIPGTRGRPRPIPPSGYPLPRARRRHNRHSCEGRNPSLGRGGGPAPFLPLGTRFRGHDDATTVIPAKAGIHPWEAGEAPPHPPSGCPLSRAWRRPDAPRAPHLG